MTTARRHYGTSAGFKIYVDSPPYPSDTTLGYWIEEYSSEIDGVATPGEINAFDDIAAVGSTLTRDVEILVYRFLELRLRLWQLNNNYLPKDTPAPTINFYEERAKIRQDAIAILSSVAGGGFPAIKVPSKEKTSNV